MSRTIRKTLSLLLIALALALLAGLAGDRAQAQGPTRLRVEEAVTGQLTEATPLALYTVSAYESLRMAVIFDVLDGDMQPTLVVLDQDGSTVLAGGTGIGLNGVVVNFPTQGDYTIGLDGSGTGTQATYRLFVQAAPPLPINTFVLQKYLVAGTATSCADNTPVGSFSATEDLNVCFALDLIDQPINFAAEWWMPSGEIYTTETGVLDSSFNGQLLLTGLYYQDTPWQTGWWQVHFVIDGELADLQWVPVR